MIERVKKDEKVYLRRHEAADYLAVSLRQLDEWKANGDLPHIYLGRRLVLFTRNDLDAFMRRNRVAVGESD
jgi:excisionase family DNA binding protein